MLGSVFLTMAEGGRQSPPASGVRPQLEIGGVHTSALLTSASGAPTIPLGEVTEVDVELMFPKRFEAEFPALRDARFFEGSRLVATGSFLEDGAP